MSNIVYCLFNLETNGLGKHFNDIIEMYALLTSTDGIATTHPPFYSKCKPMRGVGYTEQIHGISDKMLLTEKLFDVVGANFMHWLNLNTEDSQTICLVAYNGNRFDVPFLLCCCDRYAVAVSPRIFYSLDPLKIIQSLVWSPIPQNKKLGTIYKYITGSDLTNAHSAAADVIAMLHIFIHLLYGENPICF